MGWQWLALALVFAVGDWYFVSAGKVKLRFITKPEVIAALLVGFSLAGGWQGQAFWFGLGLVFAMAGDVFLLLPPRFFLLALSAFFLCHLLYLIGFTQGLSAPLWAWIIPFAVILVVDFFSYRRIRRAIIARPKGRWLRFPVHFYQIILSAVLLAATLTLWCADWPRPAAILVSAGALLFFISDTLLAYTRFVTTIRGGRLMVIASYHIGQMALISGVLLRA